MRGFLRTLAVTGAATAALLGAGLTGTAAAQAPAATRLTGGTTTVTTGPGGVEHAQSSEVFLPTDFLAHRDAHIDWIRHELARDLHFTNR